MNSPIALDGKIATLGRINEAGAAAYKRYLALTGDARLDVVDGVQIPETFKG